MTCWCGKSSFSPETCKEITTKSTTACRQHWGERQDSRISALFAMLEETGEIRCDEDQLRL